MVVRPVCFIFSSILYDHPAVFVEFWILLAMIVVLLLVLWVVLSTILSRQHCPQAVLMQSGLVNISEC